MRKNPFFALALALFVSFAQSAQASPPTLSNLDASQVDTFFKTFGAGFTFKPLEPASSYGKLWGLSIGVTGSLTSASSLTSAIPNSGSFSYLPSANLFLGVQGPYGIGVELGVLPSISISGFSSNSFGGDVKWTATDVFAKALPIDVAFRVMYSSTSLSYGETVNGASDTISLSTKQFGINASASLNLLVLQPYAGIGFINESGTLSDNGTVNLYNNSVTASDSYSASASSVWLYAGVQLRLLVLTLTAEYDNLFGMSEGSAKIGFKF